MTTHVFMIVDMSGSMYDLAPDVRGGFNSFLQDLESSSADYSFTVTLFDTQFISLCTAATWEATPRLDNKNYRPRGMTALLDAVGKTVTDFEAKDVLKDGDKVLVIVQTDGRENSSSEFRLEQISTMIEEREATKKWSFVFLGAGPDVWTQAGSMGFQRANTVSYGRASTRSSYSGMSRATKSFAGGASGQTVSSTIAEATGGETHEEEK